MINEKIIEYLKKYILSFAIMGMFTGVVLWLRDHSSADEPLVRYLNLADAFFIPGVIMLMVGVLVWLSTTGTFDMLSYGINRAKDSFIPSVSRAKEETFYDYKMRKDAKRAKGYSFLFISGGVYLIPSVVFLILYYSV